MFQKSRTQVLNKVIELASIFYGYMDGGHPPPAMHRIVRVTCVSVPAVRAWNSPSCEHNYGFSKQLRNDASRRLLSTKLGKYVGIYATSL